MTALPLIAGAAVLGVLALSGGRKGAAAPAPSGARPSGARPPAPSPGPGGEVPEAYPPEREVPTTDDEAAALFAEAQASDNSDEILAIADLLDQGGYTDDANACTYAVNEYEMAEEAVANVIASDLRSQGFVGLASSLEAEYGLPEQPATPPPPAGGGIDPNQVIFDTLPSSDPDVFASAIADLENAGYTDAAAELLDCWTIYQEASQGQPTPETGGLDPADFLDTLGCTGLAGDLRAMGYGGGAPADTGGGGDFEKPPLDYGQPDAGGYDAGGGYTSGWDQGGDYWTQ